MFNDYDGIPLPIHPSVGLGLILDLPPSKDKSPTIYTHLVDPEDEIYAYAEGSYGRLDNGNILVGYDVRPVIKEFAPQSGGDDSKVLWSANFGYNNNNISASSYRAYKQVWHATPSAAPSLVVAFRNSTDSLSRCAGGSTKRGYVSWNGATDADPWNVYAGDAKDSLKVVGNVVNRGFDTEFVVPQNAEFVQVAAMQGGKEVKTSNVAAV